MHCQMGGPSFICLDPVSLNFPTSNKATWKWDGFTFVTSLEEPRTFEQHLKNCLQAGLLNEYLSNREGIFLPATVHSVASWAAGVLHSQIHSLKLDVAELPDYVLRVG